MNRGFLTIHYTEPDTLTYTDIELIIGFGDKSKRYKFNTGDPAVDYRAAISKAVFLGLDSVSFSSSLDHFTMDGDLFIWQADTNGDEWLVRDPDYTWGAGYAQKTGWVSDSGAKRYRAKFTRKFSLAEQRHMRDTTGTYSIHEYITISFLSRTPVRALRYIVQQLEADGRRKPEDFAEQEINIDRKGERVYASNAEAYAAGRI